MKRQNVMFERGLRAPDGIHDGDIEKNRKPVEWKQPILIGVLLVLFIIYSRFVYLWG